MQPLEHTKENQQGISEELAYFIRSHGEARFRSAARLVHYANRAEWVADYIEQCAAELTELCCVFERKSSETQASEVQP